MPPPALRHFFVAGAGQAHRELVGALAAVDQVRVAIDQARRDERAAAVAARQAGELRPAARCARRSSGSRRRDDDGRIAAMRGRRPARRREPQAGPDAVGGGRASAWCSWCSGCRRRALSTSAPRPARHRRRRVPACQRLRLVGPPEALRRRAQRFVARSASAPRSASSRPCARAGSDLARRASTAHLGAQRPRRVITLKSVDAPPSSVAVERHVAAEGEGLERRVEPMVDAAVAERSAHAVAVEQHDRAVDAREGRERPGWLRWSRCSRASRSRPCPRPRGQHGDLARGAAAVLPGRGGQRGGVEAMDAQRSSRTRRHLTIGRFSPCFFAVAIAMS